MATADRVQVLPGIPGIQAISLTTAWVQLPRVDHCISVFVRPRPGGSDGIYLATSDGAASEYQLRMLASDPGITIDTDSPNRLWARAASSTATLELVVVIGVR